MGGIFFDDQNDREPEKIFEFAKDAVNNVVNAYGPIVEKHKDDEFTQKQKEWQLMRRGRYVEFNLLFDRGTIFGIQSNGRTESILMSLPPEVNWGYQWHPEKGSAEEKLYTDFLPARDWV